MWNTTDVKPNATDHIIALTKDGGSSLPLYVHPTRGFVGADGEVYDDDFLTEQCDWWCLAPDGYTWWIERGDDGQDLAGINTDAVLNEDDAGPIEMIDEASAAPVA